MQVLIVQTLTTVWLIPNDFFPSHLVHGLSCSGVLQSMTQHEIIHSSLHTSQIFGNVSKCIFEWTWMVFYGLSSACTSLPPHELWSNITVILFSNTASRTSKYIQNKLLLICMHHHNTVCIRTTELSHAQMMRITQKKHLCSLETSNLPMRSKSSYRQSGILL